MATILPKLPIKVVSVERELLALPDQIDAVDFRNPSAIKVSAQDLDTAEFKDSTHVVSYIPKALKDVIKKYNKDFAIGKIKVSEGGLAMTVVCKKKLFSQVFRGYPKAKALILAHNHPSGNLNPSRADLDITKELVDAGKILSLKVLDHIIIGGTRYTSFADEGYI